MIPYGYPAHYTPTTQPDTPTLPDSLRARAIAGGADCYRWDGRRWLFYCERFGAWYYSGPGFDSWWECERPEGVRGL
jgi:hypothetical protein